MNLRPLGYERVQWDSLPPSAHTNTRSAGTFATKKAADAAWQGAVSLVRSGRPGDQRAGQVRFANHLERCAKSCGLLR